MLNGWKAIAAYLGREERTAMRWAAERGLPIHRVPGQGRGSVFALREEIDEWCKAGTAQTARVADTNATASEPQPQPRTIRLRPIFSKARRPFAARLLIGVGALVMIAGVLALLLRPGTATLAQPAYADPAVKGMLLQARYDWNLRTPVSLDRARREYSDVIGRDPQVPDAYIGLANSYLLLREYGTLPDASAYDRAKAAAHAALALSPKSADAHRVMAFVDFWWLRDTKSARREFHRAVALNGRDPLTHHWFANALLANGEAEAAAREIALARDLDPTSTALVADQAAIWYYAGHRDAALHALTALTVEQPDAVGPHRSLSEIALAEGRTDEFLREAVSVATLRGDSQGKAQIARWRAAGPQRAAVVDTMLRDAAKAASLGQGSWFQVARVMALAGRRTQAEAALSKACANHEPALVSAPSDLWLAHSLTRGEVDNSCGDYIPLA